MRYEIKIPVIGFDFSRLQTIIKLHPANFKGVYSKRKINSIYFDDLERNSYFENIDGKSDRKKIRIRWYGSESDIIEPVLEEKIKCGHVGYKKIFALEKIKYTDLLNYEILQNYLNGISRQYYEYFRTTNLKAELLVTYLRSYYVSFNKKFRITLDEDIQFMSLGKPSRSIEKYSGNIIEIKFDLEHFGESSNILSYFPFRVDKMSKYATGINYSDL